MDASVLISRRPSAATRLSKLLTKENYIPVPIGSRSYAEARP